MVGNTSRTGRVAVAGVALFLAGATLLAGCGSDSDSDSSSTAAGPARELSGADTSAQKAAVPGAVPADEQAGATAALPVGTASRALIYTGKLTVTAPKVTAAATKAVEVVRQAGGYVASDTREDPADKDDQPTVVLTLRVPSKEFGPTVEKLAALGKERARALDTQDQQSATVDLRTRIATQQASVNRTRTLLARAESINDIVSIERELSSREAQLAASQASSATLADQVAYSTITLNLSAPEAVEPSKPKEDQPGFLTGLRNGWSAMVTVVVALGAALGWLLPFLAVIALVGIPCWRLWRRLSHRRTGAGPDTGVGTGPAPATEGPAAGA